MKVRQRAYTSEDFIPVRDFLVRTRRDFEQCYNWRLERWNYTRYFVAPLLGDLEKPGLDGEGGMEAIAFWERINRIWESDEDGIAGVLTLEHPSADHPEFGEVFPQRHPRYTSPLDEMLDYAEAFLAGEGHDRCSVFVYDGDDVLREIAGRRGYAREPKGPWYDSVFDVDGLLPEPDLPPGYVLRSMADESDVERRRELFGRGFDHPQPAEWPSAFTYRELQRAPDYCPDQDLYVVAPDGRYVSGCVAWYDEYNRMGILEPVCTHPDFRLRGLGRAVVVEAIRRMAAQGAGQVWVGSGQLFYQAIGFRMVYPGYLWTKCLKAQ